MRYYLGLGGNLGDVAATMAAAVEALREKGADVPLISSCYATAPMGEQAGERYLNAALGVDSDRTPLEMLRDCQKIEIACGRVRTVTWGPRTLDIDLLLAGEKMLRSETLTLPHPGLVYRRFALDPLCEIAPDLRHPGLGVEIPEMRRWLLPRPLDVAIRTAAGTEIESLTARWSAAVRSKVSIRWTTAPAEVPTAGWLLDCVSPVSPTWPRCVSLTDAGEPFERVTALVAAMTDEPIVVASSSLDRVRRPQ